jgi:hypothetical protein
MTSQTTRRFRESFARLPKSVQRQARAVYRLFQQNPAHPSLHFKTVHTTGLIYSVRVGLDYRALGLREADVMIWFWIGSHADYDKLVSQL